MEEISQSNYPNIEPQTPQETHGVNYVVVIAIVSFLIVVSYVLFTNTDIMQNNEENEELYSQEEKLEILEALATNPEEIPTIEEKEEILNALSEDALGDVEGYSQEEKLNILYSLQ